MAISRIRDDLQGYYYCSGFCICGPVEVDSLFISFVSENPEKAIDSASNVFKDFCTSMFPDICPSKKVEPNVIECRPEGHTDAFNQEELSLNFKCSAFCVEDKNLVLDCEDAEKEYDRVIDCKYFELMEKVQVSCSVKDLREHRCERIAKDEFSRSFLKSFCKESGHFSYVKHDKNGPGFRIIGADRCIAEGKKLHNIQCIRESPGYEEAPMEEF